MAAKSGGGFGNTSGGGFGGGFGAKMPKKQQVIIEEVAEDPTNAKLFDFNMDQVDASLLPPKDHAKPIMVGVITLICLLFGAFIGWCWQNVLAQRGEVNERINVAKEIYEIVNPKVNNFQEFTQIFKQRSESLGAGVLEYNHDFFNDVIKPYKDRNFILDISHDVKNDAISMASNGAQNPLSDLRGYAAGTTLLGALLDSHIALTEQDSKEINQLLGKSSATDRNIVYAIRVNASDILNITQMGGDRLAKAIRSNKVYQVKRAITDDQEAARIFEEMKTSGRLSADEIKARTYTKPKASAKKNKDEVEATIDENLVLPNRLLYVIADNTGRTETVFADEIILLERTKLFAGSANALERYRNRMIQILAILGEVEKTTDGLISRLHIISTEDPL